VTSVLRADGLMLHNRDDDVGGSSRVGRELLLFEQTKV
jgi:hypothetical protein